MVPESLKSKLKEIAPSQKRLDYWEDGYVAFGKTDDGEAWVRELGRFFDREDMQLIGNVLADGAQIMLDRLSQSRKATRLTGSIREDLETVADAGGELSDQAKAVLGMDLCAEAHNVAR